MLRGEHASENHHGPTRTFDRLSAASLQKHAKNLTRFIGGPRWAELPAWQPFMADLSALTEGMENFAAAMAKNAAKVQAARQQTDSGRAPDREKDLEGSGYKLHCPPGQCLEKYQFLRGCAVLTVFE